MKIGIDINPTIGKVIGKGFFLKNLLLKLSSIDKTNKYFLYGTSRPSYDLAENYKFVLIEGHPCLKWDLKCIRKARLKHKVDIFITFKSFYSAVLHPRSILGIHDIGPVSFPDGYPYETVRRFKYLLPITLKRTKRIVTPSLATKSSIVNYFKIDRKKIKKVPEAAPIWTKKKIEQEDLNRVKKRFNLPENYFIFTGTLEPRKNVISLIEAFKEFKEEDKEDYKLVVVGKKGYRHEEIFKRVIDLELTHDVIFTGHVARFDLKPLYALAKAFVFPSILEGFGLSPLEAMACGVPVISSRKGAIAEVVNKANLEINPFKVKQIKNALAKIAKDRDLRDKLISKGKKRAKEYSWEKSARKMLKIYDEVIQN